MVKDLQYFINAENEFCKEHPNYGELFFDTSIGEMSEQGINDRLNYLSDRIISKYNKIIKEPTEKELEFGLSDGKHSANPVFPPLKVLPSFA